MLNFLERSVSIMSDYKYQRPSLLHPEKWGDPDETVEGINFTRGDFEDLIDNFSAPEEIATLLQTTPVELDRFCNEIYNMDFKTTYQVLFQRANLFFKKAMMMLSKSGNPTAIKVAAEYYVKLGAVDKQDNHITIINSMPEDDSDLEKLQRHQDAIEAANKAEEGFKK